MAAGSTRFVYDRRMAEDFESFRLHSRSGVPLDFIEFPRDQLDRFISEAFSSPRKDSSTILARVYLYTFDRRVTDELPYMIMDLFRLGFLRRSAEALYLLGTFYMEGYGLRRSESAAYDMFTQAAGLGLATASFQLGICSFHGIGASQNMAAARRRFVEAMAIRDPDCRAYIAAINLLTSESEEERRSAFRRLESAARDTSDLAVSLTREALQFHELRRSMRRSPMLASSRKDFKEE